MFRDFALADRDGDRWLEVAAWDDVRPERAAWQGVQIWTRNSIYELDWTLRCVSVTTRRLRREQPDHPLVGQHLVGSFGREPGEPLLEEELPDIGRCAVFSHLTERPARLTRTSPVDRIRVRMRPARAEAEPAAVRESRPSWAHA